jgi:hypothetical protein
VSVGAVCAGKVTRKCLEKWKKGEKNSRVRGSPSSLERRGENARKKRLVFLRLKTKAFLLFCFGLDVSRKSEFLRSAFFSLCACLSLCVITS